MASYRIDYNYGNDKWHIYLIKETLLGIFYIKGATANSEKLRDEIVEDFKLNREKYEKEHEEERKRHAPKTIPI
jgi:hypothetical protein